MKTHHYARGVDYTDEQLARELIRMSSAVEIAMSTGGAWLVKRAGERMLELLSDDSPSAVETIADRFEWKNGLPYSGGVLATYDELVAMIRPRSARNG